MKDKLTILYLVLGLIPYALLLLPIHEYYNWTKRMFKVCYWIRVVMIIAFIFQLVFAILFINKIYEKLF